MPAEVLIAIAVVLTTAAHTLFSHRVKARQTREQLDILKRGTDTQGRVVAISRPLASGGLAEVYFSFESARGEQLRSCTIDLKALREQHGTFVPTVGAAVQVRYLPEAPARALLPQLTTATASNIEQLSTR